MTWYLRQFNICFPYLLYIVSVFCVVLNSGCSDVDRSTQELSKAIGSQLGNTIPLGSFSGIPVYDEIQDRTITGNEIQSILMNVSDESTVREKVLTADILSNFCWNQTLRKNLREAGFPLDSFDVSEIRKAAINLYEDALQDETEVRSGLVHLRLANSYTGLAGLQESEEKTASRSTAFQHYLSAHESEDSTEEEKIQALRGAVNTLDALQKLDEKNPVTRDETVFVLIADQINRMRTLVNQLIEKQEQTLDDLQTLAAFANAIWVIGDSETAKKRDTVLPSVEEAYQESIRYYQHVVEQTARDKAADKQPVSERLAWLNTGLDARIWRMNITQDAGYIRLKVVEKELYEETSQNLFEYTEYVETVQPVPDSDLSASIDLSHLLKCQYYYVMKEFKQTIECVDQYFGERFKELTKDTPETKSTQIVAVAQRSKYLSLFNLGLFEEEYEVAVRLLELDKSHIFPGAQKDYWAESQMFYVWALNDLERWEESREYRAYLGETYPEMYPDYVRFTQKYKILMDQRKTLNMLK